MSVAGELSPKILSDSSLSNWNAFFSSLALAEKAAAEQCHLISKHYAREGNAALADEYAQLFEEETTHFQLASAVCLEAVEASNTAKAVYAGGLLSKNPSILERMAVIHLVFEPAALAFLGYLYQESKSLFTDALLVKRIERNFALILRDEVNHVNEGSKIVANLWAAAPAGEHRACLKSIRRHRAFLVAGLKSFFKDDPEARVYLTPMLDRFESHYSRAVKGVAA
jgi:uncharacterized ferritin-like protein (DUF455 family)